MNKANKSIGWTDYTWNPIKGICPVGCWYCYAKKIYKRFKLDSKLSWDGKVPILSNKKPSKIFICSTIEMFHPQVPKEWRDRIFRIIKNSPQHTFQILTKMPENIDREMPDNVWLGCSITGNEYAWRKGFDLHIAKARIKFISFEPLLNSIRTALLENLDCFSWIIIGKLTGFGNKYNPSRIWIENIVKACQKNSIPLFLKDNLKEIWGEKLIQEFPNVRMGAN